MTVGRSECRVNKRTVVRRVAVLAILVSGLYLGVSALTGTESGRAVSAAAEAESVPFDERDQIVPERDGVTVMTGQGFANRSGDALIAFAPDGRPLYYESEYGDYQDVDPSPRGARTVLFTATEYLSAGECNAETRCARDVIGLVNLTTGDRETLWTATFQRRQAAGIHDVDRINDTHLLVGGFYRDRVFILNHSSGMITWQYSFQQDFPIGGGGPFPGDWTHLNDVELLPDGTIMASPRNQDQVVFIDREDGLIENRTLGADGAHDVLYEQHNPDYIPAERGGPAVVVADSENYRIVEYQRSDGGWNRTWIWQDDTLAWPRDADRLPNGHTLITDTHGGRLLEIDTEGEIVWQIDAEGLYEAERLGTGPESQGGRSASALGLENRTVSAGPSEGGLTPESVVEALVPRRVRSGILFVLPAWFGPGEMTALAILASIVPTWLLVEFYYSSYRVRSPIATS
jgi:hypothetical protein